MITQIEKFIETIFPTQNAEDAQRKVTGELTLAQAKKREVDAENKADIYFMMALMGAVIFFVAGTMVGPSNPCLDHR